MISANVIDHMFMFMFIAVKIFDIAMCLVVICTVFFLRLSFKIEFFYKMCLVFYKISKKLSFLKGGFSLNNEE